MVKTESLGVRIQPEIKAALERVAAEDHRSLSSMIEKILAEHLREHRADGYAWEKAYLAARGLATSTRSLQERVGDAYIFNLIHVRPENVSDPKIRTALAEIGDRLTRVEARRNEGKVAATVILMSDDEAQEIAGMIFELHDRISRQYGQG